MTAVNHPLDFSSTGQFSPPKTPFSGTHFTDADVSGEVLHGARRGSSPQATDAHRVKLGRGAPAAVHAYRSGAVAHSSIAARKNAYSINGDKSIANIDGPQRQEWATALTSAYKDAIASGADPQTAKLLAQNSAEHALLASGWDGYESPSHQSGAVVLFGDQKISTGERQNAKSQGNNSSVNTV